MCSCLQSRSFVCGRMQLIFKSLPPRKYIKAMSLDPLKGAGAVGVSSMKFIETSMHVKHESDLFSWSEGIIPCTYHHRHIS